MSVRILIGDVFAQLALLPDCSVDCVVTSPPYWGLRDYGTATWNGGNPSCDHRSPTMRKDRDEQRAALAGSTATNSAQLLLAHRSACGKCGAMKVDQQIGLEPTLGEHLDVMVRVFGEIWRVLKPTGTLWLNYGDCYATSPNGRSAADTNATGNDDRTFRDKPFSTIGGALKAKDLCMVPNRLAIALQEAGWWVRSEIIWAKPNPMPESITDRPATAHEKIFLLSKSGSTTGWRARDTGEWGLTPDLCERIASPTEEDPLATVNRWRGCDYYYDAVAVRQGAVGQNDHDLTGGRYAPPGQAPHTGTRKGRQDAIAASAAAAGGSSGRRMAGFNERWAQKQPGRANADSFARKHKATAGDHGQKPQHRPDREEVAYLRGAGRNLRNYEPPPMQVWKIATAAFSEAHFATFPPELAQRCLLAGCPKGGKVLDPFGGAGTVGLVASTMGLDCDLIELNPEYAQIARRRLRAGLARVEMDAPETNDFGPLFADDAA